MKKSGVFSVKPQLPQQPSRHHQCLHQLRSPGTGGYVFPQENPTISGRFQSLLDTLPVRGLPVNAFLQKLTPATFPRVFAKHTKSSARDCPVPGGRYTTASQRGASAALRPCGQTPFQVKHFLFKTATPWCPRWCGAAAADQGVALELPVRHGGAAAAQPPCGRRYCLSLTEHSHEDPLASLWQLLSGTFRVFVENLFLHFAWRQRLVR